MPSRNPLPAADVVIEFPDRRIVLIRRRNPPPGWAIPGGFIEYGEPAEQAAAREAREETGLDVELTELFNVYSDPARDPRHHTLAVVFLGRSEGELRAGDDAAEAQAFEPESLPLDLAFDHARVLTDYLHYRRTGERPKPRPCWIGSLPASERAELLAIARAAIRRTLEGQDQPPVEPRSKRLREPGSAFVSLHLAGQLRGCIGHMTRDLPLCRVVRDMALAAGFDDPRFPPLQAEELPGLEIEISVLTPPQPASSQQVIPGLHGVCVSRGGKRAVYLPQVAREEGWGREQLLDQVCIKAGLDPDAWKDPTTQLAVFTAEVFGDRDCRS